MFIFVKLQDSMAQAPVDWGLSFMVLCPYFVDTPLLAVPVPNHPQVPEQQAMVVEFEGEEYGPETLIT